MESRRFVYLFRWCLLLAVSTGSSRQGMAAWDLCLFPGPNSQQILCKSPEELFSTWKASCHRLKFLLHYRHNGMCKCWRSKEPFVLYLDHHFFLWRCLMWLPGPFDALLRTENSPAMSQPLRQLPASPMLSPTDWHLLAVIWFRGKSWLHSFLICIFNKGSGVFFLLSVKISGVNLKVEDTASKSEISPSTSWAS